MHVNELTIDAEDKAYARQDGMRTSRQNPQAHVKTDGCTINENVCVILYGRLIASMMKHVKRTHANALGSHFMTTYVFIIVAPRGYKALIN